MREYTVVVQEVILHTVIVRESSEDAAHEVAFEAIACIGEEDTVYGLVSILSDSTHFDTVSISDNEEGQ